MTGDLAVDHLVVAASTLDIGVQWCEQTLGVTPDAGGDHVWMGTHNRLLALSSAAFPKTYLEIISVNPNAPPPGHARWFDLDEPGLQRAIATTPMLIHWVARSADVNAACARWRGVGIERGSVVQAERATPAGLLRWKIAVRPDGQRLAGGALPTLIEWNGAHPTDTLPNRGVALVGMQLRGLPPGARQSMPSGVELLHHAVPEGSAAALQVALSTPRGTVVLTSPD